MDKCNDLAIKCPIDKAANIFSKKWTIQIIRDLFFGKTHFKEFQEDKPKLSNKVLSERLKELESYGLIEKRIISTSPLEIEYHLTSRGHNLNKVIYELMIFILDKTEYEEYKDDTVKTNIKNSFKEALDI